MSVGQAGRKEQREELLLNRMVLKQLLEQLNGQERKLIYLRYFAEKTQSAVGKKLGISQVQVSRMEKRILENLRRSAEEESKHSGYISFQMSDTRKNQIKEDNGSGTWKAKSDVVSGRYGNGSSADRTDLLCANRNDS